MDKDKEKGASRESESKMTTDENMSFQGSSQFHGSKSAPLQRQGHSVCYDIPDESSGHLKMNDSTSYFSNLIVVKGAKALYTLVTTGSFKKKSDTKIEDIRRETAEKINRMHWENYQELEKIKSMADEKQRLAELAARERQCEIKRDMDKKKQAMDIAESKRQKELLEQEMLYNKAARERHEEVERKKAELEKQKRILRDEEKRKKAKIQQEGEERREKLHKLLQYEKATENFQEWCNQPD